MPHCVQVHGNLASNAAGCTIPMATQLAGQATSHNRSMRCDRTGTGCSCPVYHTASPFPGQPSLLSPPCTHHQHTHPSTHADPHHCFHLTPLLYMYSPSGTPSFFLYSTFSLALRKSAWVTRMRRSRSASSPDSVHTALMSAPAAAQGSHAWGQRSMWWRTAARCVHQGVSHVHVVLAAPVWDDSVSTADAAMPASGPHHTRCQAHKQQCSTTHTSATHKLHPRASHRPTRAAPASPDSSSLLMTNSSRLTSSERVILLVWMLKMRRLVLASGRGNSILRSIRPGRMSAGSSVSIRLVAMMTCRGQAGARGRG